MWINKTSIILIALTFCLALSVLYYLLYFKNIVIYDIVKIEISGVPSERVQDVKIYGITPVSKKIDLSKVMKHQSSQGCFKSIELNVPDSLSAKNIEIHIDLKKISYSFRIIDLNPIHESDNTIRYILPSTLRSKGTFFQKLFLAYPFNVFLSMTNKVFRLIWVPVLLRILLFIVVILFVVFVIVVFWKYFNGVIKKGPIQKYYDFLTQRKIHYFILFILVLGISIWPILFPLQVKLIYYLIVLLVFSLVLQVLRINQLRYLLFLFRLLVITFIFSEIFFRVLDCNKNKNVDNSWEVYAADSVLGMRLKPNCNEFNLLKTINGDTAYYASFSSDNNSMRVADEKMLNDSFHALPDKTNHAIFLGCSFTFGMGLNYYCTFPYIFEKSHKNYKSYNYGVFGYGTHHCCLLFDEGINTINNKSVPEDSGFCMYTYIDDHLDRVFGSSGYLSYYKNTPYVSIENDNLKRKKIPFLQTCLAWILNNSSTMNHFKIEFKHPKNEEFYKRFAGLVNYMANKYNKLKPYGRFYVSIYPYNDQNKDTAWIKFINKEIKVLRIPPPEDFDRNPSYIIKHDWHPTKELNQYYVNEISKLIDKE